MISSFSRSISAPANNRCHAHLSALHLKTSLNRLHQTSRSRSIPRGAAARDDELEGEGWVAKNQDLVRASPLIAGSLGIVSVILNRSFSGAVGLDASSAASRTDVIIIAASAILLLTGLQWLALRPVEKEAVQLDGQELAFSHKNLPAGAKQELEWAWRALQSGTRCRALVVFIKGVCVFHFGAAKHGVDASKSVSGPLCRKAMEEEKGNYLANLGLYPGRFEFLSYLPSNTQGVIVRPIGQKGALIAATDTQRGFGKLDQAWISLISDKVESSLETFSPVKQGFGSPAVR